MSSETQSKQYDLFSKSAEIDLTEICLSSDFKFIILSCTW